MTQKPRASVGQMRPRTPAGVWFGAGSRDVSCRFILINLISGQRSAGHDHGEGGIFFGYLQSIYSVQGLCERLSPPNNPEQKP